jgi:hypothetical protein
MLTPDGNAIRPIRAMRTMRTSGRVPLYVYCLSCLNFDSFIKVTYQQTVVGVMVEARVPQFEKPCCNDNVQCAAVDSA